MIYDSSSTPSYFTHLVILSNQIPCHTKSRSASGGKKEMVEMRKLFVLFGVFIFLFSQSVVARVTPFDTNTELLITHFERALKLIIADDYFLGEDEWKLRNIYTNILKEIGREDDVVKRYRGFARMTDLKMFRGDLRDQLREYLENKPNKTLFMRRLTKLLLEQDPYAQFFSEEDFKKSLKGKPYSDDGLIFGAQDH